MKLWRSPAAVVLVLATTALSACGQSTSDDQDPAPAASESATTLDSCGRSVTFERRPKSVLAVGSEAPSLLVAAGAGDVVTHYAGSLEVPFDSATKEIVEKAERVSEDSHDVSFETIVSSGVDAVIGTDIGAGVDIDALAKRLDEAGIALVTVSGYCAGIDGRSTAGLSGFDLIYRDVTSYGELFGTSDQAAKSVASMKSRVDKATALATSAQSDDAKQRTAAALYVPVSGTLGSYGSESLVSEQMEILGLRNVFDDVPKRYFEPSTESLVDSQPDQVVAVYLPTGDSALETQADVVKALNDRSELRGLDAVKDDRTLTVLNYYYTSPGPLAVEGLELMAQKLGADDGS